MPWSWTLVHLEVLLSNKGQDCPERVWGGHLNACMQHVGGLFHAFRGIQLQSIPGVVSEFVTLQTVLISRFQRGGGSLLAYIPFPYSLTEALTKTRGGGGGCFHHVFQYPVGILMEVVSIDN